MEHIDFAKIARVKRRIRRHAYDTPSVLQATIDAMFRREADRLGLRIIQADGADAQTEENSGGDKTSL